VQGAAVEVALVGGGGPAARGRDRLQRKHGAVGGDRLQRKNTAKIRHLEHGGADIGGGRGTYCRQNRYIQYRIIRCCTNKGERCTANKSIGQTEIAFYRAPEKQKKKILSQQMKPDLEGKLLFLVNSNPPFMG
jgi:hypothetical protein